GRRAARDGLAVQAVHALVIPGDPVLIEKPVYAGVIPMFETLLCEMIEVETDADGLDLQSLRNILDSWPSTKPKPKILYTIPYGCNPTGATTSLTRRQEVLDVSRKHNILIIEDDPYYFMYFGTRPRIPSYFTLEAQTGDRSVGRVLRFDSFSKIISAGIRIGFVTGPTPLLDAIDTHGHGEPVGIVLLPGGRRHPPARVGARRLPRARAQSRGLLSREAGGV
ncbi:pyridoxal phosphate-dependent transferase, partial [Lactarius psammicola]